MYCILSVIIYVTMATIMIKRNKHSIVIVGAGLVGTSFALNLKNTEFSIQILETQLPDIKTQSHTNSRPISLSYGSVCILKTLSVWDKLEPFSCPILSVHVSEKGKFGFTEFSAKAQKVPALGYVVPFSRLQTALYHQAVMQHNVTLTPIHSIEKIQCDLQGATIQTPNEKIETNLLVAADGTHSTCRDLLGISYIEKNNGDIAYIYQLHLLENHNNIAYERFTKLGVLAVLPLFEKKTMQLVWTISPVVAKKINHWADKDTLQFLQDTFEGRLDILSAQKTAQFPLKIILAEKQITQSAILLGNSAHTIYPIAAQGFNLGLHDAALFSEIIMDAIKNKKDINDIVLLKKYEAQVHTHQEAIFRIANQLTPLFDLPFIGSLRGLGLLSINIMTPLKNKLVRRTMAQVSHSGQSH